MGYSESMSKVNENFSTRAQYATSDSPTGSGGNSRTVASGVLRGSTLAYEISDKSYCISDKSYEG